MAKISRIVRWFLIGAVIVGGVALAVPFLVPASGFIPEITRIASASLGQPVTIDALEARLLPTPRVVATGVRIGKKAEVAIGELEIVPELLSLFAGNPALRVVRAEKVEVKEAALAIAERMPKGGDAMELRRLVLRDVRLQHSALNLPPIDLDVRLRGGVEVERALLETRDGSLKLLLDPGDAGKILVKLEARGWRLPLAAAPLVFDSLTAAGQMAGKRLELSSIDGRLYGGTVKGTARTDWAKAWQVAGTAALAGVDLAAVQKAIGNVPHLSGKVSGNAKFSATAKTADLLVAALAIDGPFNIVDSLYSGVDLAKVGDLTGSKGAGGSTRFDELRGVLELRGRQVRVKNLCAKSSALVAAGFVEVAPNQTLTGRLDLSMAKTGGFLGVPVALSGTSQEPVVRPTRGYTIGAVVGTVLLPGVGTALGGSAGGAIEGRSGDCR